MIEMRGLNSLILARWPLVLGVGAVLSMSGCSFGSSHQDLRQYIESVKSKPVGTIEPLPPLRTYDPFVYNVTTKRSPFDPPVEVQKMARASDPQLRPDTNREREYLEAFNFDALTMVGSVGQDRNFWALIKDGDGKVNRVRVGNYIGRDHGKVVATSPTQIDVVEIVSDGLGGWLQRPRTLKLSEKE